jgi:hypothetical protein
MATNTVQEDSSSNRVSDRKEGAPSVASVSRESLADADGYGSSDEHVFSDPTVANYWRAVFEKAGYENRHRFDPAFTWTAEEERKLVRKIDLRIMLWCVLSSDLTNPRSELTKPGPGSCSARWTSTAATSTGRSRITCCRRSA